MVKQRRVRYKLFPNSKEHRAKMDALVGKLFARVEEEAKRSQNDDALPDKDSKVS